MSHLLLPRGPLTDLLVDHLLAHSLITGSGVIVGDAVVDPRAGWTGTQPGQGDYVASVVVSTGEASRRDVDTVRSRHESWVCRYGIKSIGGARQQADYTADRARAAVLDLPRIEYDFGTRWRLADIVFSRLAPVEVGGPTDAPNFAVNDVVELWVDRDAR